MQSLFCHTTQLSHISLSPKSSISSNLCPNYVGISYEFCFSIRIYPKPNPPIGLTSSDLSLPLHPCPLQQSGTRSKPSRSSTMIKPKTVTVQNIMSILYNLSPSLMGLPIELLNNITNWVPPLWGPLPRPLVTCNSTSVKDLPVYNHMTHFISAGFSILFFSFLDSEMDNCHISVESDQVPIHNGGCLDHRLAHSWCKR